LPAALLIDYDQSSGVAWPTRRLRRMRRLQILLQERLAAMGWGRTLLLGDIGTQLNVNDVERDLDQVKQYLQNEQAEHQTEVAAINSLIKENQDLKLYIATLIRLLVSKNVLSQAELGRLVNLLDPS